MKLLLFVYECSPYRGSEWAAGWGRLLGAAKLGETHVITSQGNFAALEQSRKDGLLPTNVRFYTPEPDAKLCRLGRRRTWFAYNYTAYHHWQLLAFHLARELHQREHFDLAHQATVCTFREPGYGWSLGIPFLWGPVGGTQNLPFRFLPMLSAPEMAKEALRSLTNWCALRKARVRRAGAQAGVVLAANSTNQVDLERVLRREVGLLLETGLHAVPELDTARYEARLAAERRGHPQSPLRLYWSGEFQSRKALPVLLDALALLPCEVGWSLDVLGDGPLRGRWERHARRLGLAERVRFHGRLPLHQAVEQLRSADLFCFTSLRDTSGNVLLESMAAGVPVLCFEHQGAADIVNEFSGIRIPVSTPAQAARDWSDAIALLAGDARKLYALSRGATRRARRFLWSENHEVVNGLYRQLVQASPRSVTSPRGPQGRRDDLFELPTAVAHGPVR